MAGRIDGHMVYIPFCDTGNSIDLRYPVYFVTKKFYTNRPAAPISRINLDSIAPYSELITGEVNIISFVTDLRKLFKDGIKGILLTNTQRDHHTLIVNRVSKSIQATYRRHNNDISAFKQRRGCAVSQTVNFLIDCGIFLNIGICVGNIRLRLIVIIVGYKILNRIIGEEFPEFRT